MVSTNYTVSTAAQLLGHMPPVRVSGSRSRTNTSNAVAGKHVKASDDTIRLPPTKPLPPTPIRTVRERASRSSDVLPLADKVKLKLSNSVPEDEVVTLPATVYTPTNLMAINNPVALVSDIEVFPKVGRVPKIGAPIPKGVGKPSTVLEGDLRQYYEYITPSASLLGRSGSRRERKASHTPSSSGGSDIYFSPIDTASNQVLLSSPQPSPPISPADMADTPKTAIPTEKLSSLTIEDESLEEPAVKVVDFAGAAQPIEQRKVTLTLTDVDRLSIALASAALVQMRVRKSPLDDLPANMVATSSDKAAESTPSTVENAGLPTPPPSEASTSEEVGGIALINTNVGGAPVSLSSSDAFLPGRCTHLTIPYGLTSTSRLRIEPPSTSSAESKIILQSLFAVLKRKTGAQEFTLLSETDVTPSFARAALTELAHHSQITLDELEIATPTVATSPDDGSIDWCTVDQNAKTPPAAAATQTNHLLDETLSIFSSSLSAETCTIQTLTLLSELSRLQNAHRTFLVLQPTKFDARGGLAAVKVPLVSQALRKRFAQMDASSASGGSSSSTAQSSEGQQKSRRFREAVIAAAAPRFVDGEEFETFVEVEDGKVRVRTRCVPLAAGGKVEKWVCFLGSEYDILY